MTKQNQIFGKKTMKSIQYLGIFAFTLLLAACGGGSSNNSFGGGGLASLTMSSASGTVVVNPQNFAPDPDSPSTTQISVQFRTSSGTPVADGTIVTLSSSSSARGVVSPIDSPGATASEATVGTAGGTAEFWFTAAGQTGTVTLTASAANPSGGTPISTAITVNVVEGTPDDERFVVSAASDTVVVNPQNFPPDPNSPNTTQVTVQFLNGNGTPIADGTTVSLSTSSVARGVVSPIDQPDQTGSSVSTTTIGGRAEFYFTAGAQTGAVTLTASTPNPAGGAEFSATTQVVVIDDGSADQRFSVSAASDSVEVNPQNFPPDPNSPNTTQVTVQFLNANGTPVADGTTVTLASSSVALGVVSPIDAPTQTGSSAAIGTVGGRAEFWFTAASQTGTVTLTATSPNPAGGASFSATTQIEVEGAGGGEERFTVSATPGSVIVNPQNFPPDPSSPNTAQVTVQFLNANGSPVADGTSVSLTSGNEALGVVSSIDQPTVTGSVASNVTTAGRAEFLFTAAGQTGMATLTASAANPAGGSAFTASTQVLVGTSLAQEDRLTVSSADDSVVVNPQNFDPDPDGPYSTQITVQFLNPDGTPVADDTQVTLSSSSVARGVVSPINALAESGSSATIGTTGGRAEFLLTAAGQTGTLTLTASAPNPSGGSVFTASTDVIVESSVAVDDRLTIEGSNTIPTNEQNVPIFIGSPFINELTIRYVGPDGEAGFPADGQVGVAIAPVTLGAFSTLDDPETDDVNELFVLIGSGPVNMTAGVATVFVHSADQPGSVTLTVTAVDAESGEQFTTDFVIEIEDGAANFLPSSLQFSVDPEPVYAQGAGGNSTKNIQIFVNDSGGNAVPNPEQDGVRWNNVRLRLEGPAGSGARLVGTGAEGSVDGTEISVATVNGVASFALNAGSETGSHRIIATVDRADNNVDQGITDPLNAETTAAVGDGQLFALEIVSPVINSININRVAGSIQTEFIESPDTGVLVPIDPDGTYSLTVTVQGTDKIGNPVLPGTTVNFGKIDAPMAPGIPRIFAFSGGDGNPQEGGTLFSAFDPFEGFLDDPIRVDEAVEPGDTVALFGKSVPGNRQHEASRLVASVIDENTANVTEAFNPNDQTGASVDDGFVIPWVIGRSQIGTIDQNVVLDETGRGSVLLTYPIDSLGRPIVLWGQGTRVQPDGNVTVADVESALLPGVRPLQLSATPSTIQASTDSVVRLCLRDAIRSPIEGAFITGGISEGSASGTLDSVGMTTTTAQATGTAGPGCVDTLVNVSGIPPATDAGDDDGATITFSFAGATADVTVVPLGAASLLVDPSRINDTSLTTFDRVIDLTLLAGSGAPISGVQLVGECEADEGILALSRNPGVTDENGETTARVLVGMAGCATDGGTYPRLGTCTFSTTTGTPEGVLQVLGIDVLSLGVSPPPVGCPPEEEPDTRTLIVQVEDNRALPQPSSLVQSIPPAISCSVSSPLSDPNCRGEFDPGTTVVVRAPSGSTPVFSGACSAQPGSDPNFGEVAMVDPSQVCVVTFN